MKWQSLRDFPFAMPFGYDLLRWIKMKQWITSNEECLILQSVLRRSSIGCCSDAQVPRIMPTALDDIFVSMLQNIWLIPITLRQNTYNNYLPVYGSVLRVRVCDRCTRAVIFDKDWLIFLYALHFNRCLCISAGYMYSPDAFGGSVL